MIVLLQALAGGLMIGAIYTLVALGYTLTLGVLDVVNFAHGQFTMISMYISIVIFATLGIDPFIGAPVNAIICFILGVLVYQISIKPATSKKHSTQIVVTMGLVLVIQNIILLIFGGNIRSVTTSLTSTTIKLGGVYLGIPKLLASFVTLGVLIFLYYILQHTDFGKSIRATADNRHGALLTGIAVPNVYKLVFGISAALEGIAGAVMVSYTPVSPFFGFELGLKAFVIVVIAGLGSIPGAIIGGLLIGILETLGTVFFSASFNVVLIYGLLILVLIFKPSGLFQK